MIAENDQYILVIGDSSDGQLLGVVETLLNSGAPTVFLDADTCIDVSVDIDRDGRLSLFIDGKPLPKPTLTWSRIKIRSVVSDWSGDGVNEFVRRSEWKGFLTSLSQLLDDTAIYPLMSAWRAENKLDQFRIAGDIGFKIPPTSLFVGKNHALRFVGSHDSTVAKPIVSRNIPKLKGDQDEYRVLLTMAVDPAVVEDAEEEEFQVAPVFFQSRICAGVERRIIAFRDEAFSFEVRGRLEEKQRPDERMLYGGTLRNRQIYGSQYRTVDTSLELQGMLSEFLNRMNLMYGAFDILVEPDGSVVFLECNAEGQWCAAGNTISEINDHWSSTLINEFHLRLSAQPLAAE